MKQAFLALLLCPLIAVAKPWWLSGSKANPDEFLAPDAAFTVSSVTDGDLIRVRWIIADGYYLYRTKFDIKPESPDLSLEQPVLPPGISRTDEYFGTQEIYQEEVTAVAAFKRGDAGAHPLQIRVTYQGCAEAGLCYPPIVKVLSPDTLLEPSAATARATGPAAAGNLTATATATDNPAVLFAILGGVLAFFIAGLNLRRKHDPSAL